MRNEVFCMRLGRFKLWETKASVWDYGDLNYEKRSLLYDTRLGWFRRNEIISPDMYRIEEKKLQR